MRIPEILLAAGIAAVLLTAGCGQKEAAIDPARLAVFTPLPEPAPAATPVEQERIALGRMLYYDARLSRDQKVSCNDCHDLAAYGVDGQPTSPGFRGQRGSRNSPTVYNAALQFVQFWDGRAADVEAQAKGPILNPVEMAMPSDQAVVAVVRSIPGYVSAFKRAYPDSKQPVTYDNVGNAIGAFERRLLTPSRWDRFLKGDQNALTAEEKRGFVAFTDAGCDTCHAGALVGGNLYQKIGLRKPYPDTADEGRYLVTHNDSDRLMFKVPTLRNIEKTGPYFHHGKIAGLDQAIRQMSDYQLGSQLSAAQATSILAFLKSLTGELPADYIKKPELPASTPRTPKAREAD